MLRHGAWVCCFSFSSVQALKMTDIDYHSPERANIGEHKIVWGN
jgi:hypothetical protein